MIHLVMGEQHESLSSEDDSCFYFIFNLIACVFQS